MDLGPLCCALVTRGRARSPLASGCLPGATASVSLLPRTCAPPANAVGSPCGSPASAPTVSCRGASVRRLPPPMAVATDTGVASRRLSQLHVPSRRTHRRGGWTPLTVTAQFALTPWRVRGRPRTALLELRPVGGPATMLSAVTVMRVRNTARTTAARCVEQRGRFVWPPEGLPPALYVRDHRLTLQPPPRLGAAGRLARCLVLCAALLVFCS